ncbi:hypothetical protein OsI_00659 [Oryza sativa Indica Group]|uniref:Ubiquitin-like domain-containing protein n=1 Tax=Oryza sativa subsp. indica TaxID=39946 RepID=B8ADL1_ORYSI|nr:hypothetical protein OsI_00659 [Oryza sativa Indica Group]
MGAAEEAAASAAATAAVQCSSSVAKAKVKAAGQLVACGSLVTPTETMIHSGGRGRRRRRRRRRGSKGPYERGGGGDGDQAAKGCMDAAATGAKTGSTLSSGCCAAKAPAWMEEFSGDSTLCKKKDNTLDEVKEVVHVKQDAPPPSSFLPNSSGLQSLFVKACGVNISVQVDLSNTKVDYLINSACQKMRVNVKDTYAVLCGKILEYNKSLSDYPLYRNSTIEIRFRGRAGQPMTFDEKFDDIHANTWFYTVDLVPALQRQTRTNPPVLPWLSVRYFSDFASYNIQKVLNHITAMHWENLSYNGAFNSDNIIFHNGAVTIQGVLTVQFNGVTCAKDFAKLYSIFIAKFTPHGFRTKTQINRQETRLERFRDRKLDSEMKQQSGGAVNESYLARLMEACIFFVSLDRCCMCCSMAGWRHAGIQRKTTIVVVPYEHHCIRS